MDGKGGVIFFAALALVLACLAFCFLLDTPEDEAAIASIASPALTAVCVVNEPSQLSAFPQGDGVPGTNAPAALLTKTPPAPRGIERDQNGVPLIQAAYRRAAYVKFPPEAFYG